MARREATFQFGSRAHRIEVAALRRGYERIRKDAAVGVDGITKEPYGQRREDHLQERHARRRGQRYRHPPVRRVHIPKAAGTTRPIGISTTEDKGVQHALREVLEAIYEQDVRPCSFGFRPGRSAHDAIRARDRAVGGGGVRGILEADLRSFFDSLDRTRRREILGRRITDRSFLRRVGKCLHVGVRDGAHYAEPDVGTAQGSARSPLLGNVYRHHVLDLGFEREVRPQLRGYAERIRYAEDFVIAFARVDDAERVMRWIHGRMERYGLALHPETTRRVPFGRPPATQRGGKGPATFDFLGVTVSWRKGRAGGGRLGFETRRERVRRALRAVAEFCRGPRHEPVTTQHTGLCRRIKGHLNYFGVSGNLRAITRVTRAATWLWHKGRSRRSPRGRPWERYRALLERFPRPTPQIHVRIWG
jgi:group II intron reverse transcriptase/maturase